MLVLQLVSLVFSSPSSGVLIGENMDSSEFVPELPILMMIALVSRLSPSLNYFDPINEPRNLFAAS
jgi:hypothetical protein